MGSAQTWCVLYQLNAILRDKISVLRIIFLIHKNPLTLLDRIVVLPHFPPEDNKTVKTTCEYKDWDNQNRRFEECEKRGESENVN